MACGDDAPWTDRLLCALTALRSEWWEPWLQVLAVVLSAVISVLIAVWVARDARKTTMAAVTQQIAAERESISIQLAAEREDRWRDVMRERAVEAATVIDRQVTAPAESWSAEIRELSAVFTRLGLALPFAVRDELEDQLQQASLELSAVRSAMLKKPEDRTELVRWSGRYRTLISMIHEEVDVKLILELLLWAKADGVAQNSGS